MKYFGLCYESLSVTEEVTVRSGFEGFWSGAGWSKINTCIGVRKVLEGIGSQRSAMEIANGKFQVANGRIGRWM